MLLDILRDKPIYEIFLIKKENNKLTHLKYSKFYQIGMLAKSLPNLACM